MVNVVVTKSGAWVDVRGIGPERSRLGDSVGPSGFSLYENYNSIHFTLKIHPWKNLYYSNMANYCPCLTEPYFKLKCKNVKLFRFIFKKKCILKYTETYHQRQLAQFKIILKCFIFPFIVWVGDFFGQWSDSIFVHLLFMTKF